MDLTLLLQFVPLLISAIKEVETLFDGAPSAEKRAQALLRAFKPTDNIPAGDQNIALEVAVGAVNRGIPDDAIEAFVCSRLNEYEVAVGMVRAGIRV